MPKGVCMVCGCTDDKACVTDGVPCTWLLPNLCDACVVPADEGRLLIPKRCKNCNRLKGDKGSSPLSHAEAEMKWYTCGEGRFDKDTKYPSGGHQWYAWRGITRPNKAVARAQNKCLDFQVVERYSLAGEGN